MSEVPSPDIVVTVSSKSNNIKGCTPCEVQPQYVYESNVHSQNILSILNQQRKQGLLCDMTVIVEGVELQAHKAVLAACSTYFNGIITDPANVSHNIVLELSSISRLGMENLLDFAYTSKLTVSKDNIDHILAAARELDIKNLEYSCLNLLKQKLNQEANDPSAPTSNCMNSSACRNSTISRKIVQLPRCGKLKVNQPICPKETDSVNNKQEDCTNRMLRKGDCPLLAQLSLESKPQPQTDVRFCHTDSPKTLNHVVQPERHFSSIDGPCLVPKGQQQLNMMQLIHLQRLRMQKNEQKCPQMKMCDTYLSKSNQQDLKPEMGCTYIPPPCSYTSSSSGGTPFSTSTFNSDTDEALSADEDGEKMQCPLLSGANSGCSKLRKHSDVVLPFSIEEITKLPRSELQILLNKHPNLNAQQINAMHEIRRRGKNRIAAQRCRKRKMDCILALQYELNRLRGDHNKLMNERRCVKEGALTLSQHFQKRYKEVFSDCKAKICKKFCEKSSTSTEEMKDSSVDPIMASMEQYFKNEVEQANNLADRICSVPCENLPPITISSMINCPSMTSSELLVCGEDSNMTDCKPYSPSACSTTSYTSEGQSDTSTICSEILPDCLLFTQNQTSVICSLPASHPSSASSNNQPPKEEEVMNVEVIQTSEEPS